MNNLQQMIQQGKSLVDESSDRSEYAYVQPEEAAALLQEALGLPTLQALNMDFLLDQLHFNVHEYTLHSEIDVPSGDTITAVEVELRLPTHGKRIEVEFWHDDLIDSVELWAAVTHQGSNYDAVCMSLYRVSTWLMENDELPAHPPGE